MESENNICHQTHFVLDYNEDVEDGAVVRVVGVGERVRRLPGRHRLGRNISRRL